MNNRLSKGKVLFYIGVLALAMSPAYADPACDAEVATIQTELDAPTTSASSSDREQARNMLSALSQDCAGGSNLDDISSFANDIRALLGMGGTS